MARSSYIYLVMVVDPDSSRWPVAAFTVKREMNEWLARHYGKYECYRMHDGLLADKSPVAL